MGQRITCFCVYLTLWVWVAVAVPVIELRPTQLSGDEPVHRVVIVKRAAQYDRPGSGFPCHFSAFRCPYPDLPALCRSYDIPNCHGTDFINVDIGH